MEWIVGQLGLRIPWLTPERVRAADVPEERAGGSGGESPYVTVYVAGSLPEAHIIKGKLETEDIPVVLRYESGATIFGLVGGGLGAVEVLVPRPLEERAQALLQARDDGDGDEEPETS